MNKKNISILLFLILFFGCDYLEKYTNKERYIDFDKEVYDTNLKKWQDQKQENYKFEYSGFGFIGFDYKIVVKDGYVNSYAYKIDNSDSGDVSGDMNKDNYDLKTIDDIFEEIIDTYNRNNGIKVANDDCYYRAINVEYDPIYGFPTSIGYDLYVPENLAVDGTFDYSLGNFEPL